MTYEVNATVTMYINAESEAGARLAADSELSLTDYVENINITSVSEFNEN